MTKKKSLKKKMQTISVYKTFHKDAIKGVKAIEGVYDATKANVFHVELLMEDVIEVKGFLFVVDAKNRTVTETRTGFNIVGNLDSLENAPFSLVVLKAISNVSQKSWEELNDTIRKFSYSYRDAYLNLLII